MQICSKVLNSKICNWEKKKWSHKRLTERKQMPTHLKTGNIEDANEVDLYQLKM